ncbi:hypothetical protein GCM10027610_035790 [Dactylosporangium cerinum]
MPRNPNRASPGCLDHKHRCPLIGQDRKRRRGAALAVTTTVPPPRETSGMRAPDLGNYRIAGEMAQVLQRGFDASMGSAQTKCGNSAGSSWSGQPPDPLY